MSGTKLTRRSVLATAAFGATSLSLPFVRDVRAAAGGVQPKGKMTLAWHTNIASRWLDPQQHDGTASPDNFLFALHDGLIKNFRDRKYDHLALADKFDFPEDAQSATFRLREGIKFHDGSPITIDDVKWSYENYRGSSAELLHEKTKNIEIDRRPHNPRSSSTSRFSIFRSCSAPAISAAPAGSCRANTTSRSAKTDFCKSRSAPGRTNWSRRNPARGSCSRRSRIITGRCM